MNIEREPEKASFKAYSSHGFDVIVTLGSTDPAEINRKLDEFLSAGFTAAPPLAEGLLPGEERGEVTHVVRRSQQNDDGTITPIIDMYVGRLAFRWSFVYLDSAQEIAEFEAAAGLHLAQMPVYNGDIALERGKKPAIEQTYVIPVPKPFKVIRNKDMNENKRLVRYDGSPSVQPSAIPPEKPTGNETHWANLSGATSRFFDTARAKGIKTTDILKLLEPGVTLSALNATSLSSAEAYKRLDEIAAKSQQAGQPSPSQEEQGEGTPRPFANSRKETSPTPAAVKNTAAEMCNEVVDIVRVKHEPVYNGHASIQRWGTAITREGLHLWLFGEEMEYFRDRGFDTHRWENRSGDYTLDNPIPVIVSRDDPHRFDIKASRDLATMPF